MPRSLARQPPPAPERIGPSTPITLRPDPSIAAQQAEFGTSGHQGSSLESSLMLWGFIPYQWRLL